MKRMQCLLVALVFVTFDATVQATQSVTFGWTQSASPDVNGYHLYYGVGSGTYSNVVDVGNVTNATLSGLVDGTTYYFALTAYDTAGLESVYSQEISYTVPVSTNGPPSISLTAPTNGASFLAGGNINLAASVAANGHTITLVRFYSGTTLLGTSSNAPYSFGWTNVGAGSYSLSAQAVYDAGSTVGSGTANITVTNPVPVVTLTSPFNGASYAAPATITLAATVTANGHTISLVRFYSGTILLGTSSNAPYSFNWATVSAGTYSLSAQAVYDAGSTVASGTANITVTNPASPIVTLTAPVSGASYMAPAIR